MADGECSDGKLCIDGRTAQQSVHIPDEADQRSGVMSITIPG
jgi:hypothetical protein